MNLYASNLTSNEILYVIGFQFKRIRWKELIHENGITNEKRLELIKACVHDYELISNYEKTYVSFFPSMAYVNKRNKVYARCECRIGKESIKKFFGIDIELLL